MLKVLGEWRPNLPSDPWSKEVDYFDSLIDQFKLHVTNLLAVHNIPGRVWSIPQIRTPQFNPGEYNIIMNWHQDNTRNGASDQAMYAAQLLVLWATAAPTEILMPDDTIWHAEPYEVVTFTNGEYKHRTPQMTESQASKRWFGRAYIQTPESDAIYAARPRYVQGYDGLSAVVTEATQQATMNKLIEYGKRYRYAMYSGTP